jgi:hypothetical protein
MEEYLKNNPQVLGALITTAGLITVAILGFIFNMYHKKFEIEKSRRTIPYDKRIEEAIKYVETLNIELLSFRQFYDILTDEPNAFHQNLKDYMEDFSDLPRLMQEFTLNASIIKRIKDKELSRLDYDLGTLFLPIMENYVNLFYLLSSKKRIDLRDIDLDGLIIPDAVDSLITKMKMRLDYLAEKAP